MEETYTICVEDPDTHDVFVIDEIDTYDNAVTIVKQLAKNTENAAICKQYSGSRFVTEIIYASEL